MGGKPSESVEEPYHYQRLVIGRLFVAIPGFCRAASHLSSKIHEDGSRPNDYLGGAMAPGDYTFHLPIGEATVTLQYVALLIGLRIDGRAITGPPCHDWRATCSELLLLTPDALH